MLDSLLNPIKLKPYDAVKKLEGTGNFAVSKYYRQPYRFFYRKKLYMMRNLIEKKNRKYHNALDFGSGSGILLPELSRYAHYALTCDVNSIIDPRSQYEIIVCGSVLEFCHLDFTMKLLKKKLKLVGQLIVASPMKTFMSDMYFKSIKDDNQRHGHKDIIAHIKNHFKIEVYQEWLGLYFALRAVHK